jgi:hypothetical protein
MFKIGDTVWFARAGQSATQIKCPDCDGTRRIRLIFANDEQVSIDCAGCSRGYEGPYGTITEYKFKANVVKTKIDGVDQDRNKITYKVNGNEEMNSYYSFDSVDIFGTEEEAVQRCQILIKEAVDRERDRLLRKEKDTKSWASNASYHRRCIKDIEKQLAYHKGKLNVAAVKAKEPSVTSPA